MPGKSHGWKSLVGYSPWGRKESDMTEWLQFLSFFLSWLKEVCTPSKNHIVERNVYIFQLLSWYRKWSPERLRKCTILKNYLVVVLKTKLSFLLSLILLSKIHASLFLMAGITYLRNECFFQLLQISSNLLLSPLLIKILPYY